jgi:hypothetical protein
MSNFKIGDIVRYNHGSTALAKLVQPHAGGWSADQCMGGGVYVSDNFRLRLADEEDLRTWNRNAWHRGCGIPPCWRPLITRRCGPPWVVICQHSSRIPQRWRAEAQIMQEQALAFVNRLNAGGAQ